MNRQPIHIDNYEDYFLLYVDEELTAQEVKDVEAFLLEHPELKPELDMYLETRLTPETVSFLGKEELFRNADEIHAGNIEELQIQWIDGELSSSRAAEVEAFTSANPEAMQNIALLKQTKLPEETIVFPDKASLYRHEEKPVMVFQMRWIRVAVAAAVILLAGLLWVNRQPAAETTIGPAVAKVEQSGAADQETTSAQKDEPNDQKQEFLEPAAVGQQPLKQTDPSNATATVLQTQQGKIPDNKNAPPVTYASVDRNTNITSVQVEQTEKGTEEKVVVPGIQMPQNNTTQVQEPLAMNVKTDYISDALNQEQFNGQEEFTGDETKSRKGFRGLIRKVNRIYNKATNPDPEKAVVKVANFEIGLPR
jgi:anti-sigma factor RsiW